MPTTTPNPATPDELADMLKQIEGLALAGDMDAAATLVKIRTMANFPGSSLAVPQYGGDQAWRLDLNGGAFGEFERVNGEWWGRLTVDGEVSQWERIHATPETEDALPVEAKG